MAINTQTKTNKQTKGKNVKEDDIFKLNFWEIKLLHKDKNTQLDLLKFLKMKH